MAVAIRPMTPADLEPAIAAVRDRGWGDRRSWFAFALGHPACDPLVAVDGGDVIGTGVGTRNGPAGWVGTIFVAPSRRREGIGMAISTAVCERLEAAGCRTLLLVATDQGRPVYGRLGFEVETWYRVLEHDGTSEAGAAGEAGGADPVGRAGDVPLAVGPFGRADVADAATLDREATGEDREHLLAAFASVPGGLAVRAGGAPVGFVVRAPWGGGATVAATPAAAERLLATRLAVAGPGHPVRAGLLEPNEAGLERLAELGWREVYRVPRMRRGAPLDWRPDRIWGQFNFALG